jgi:hypothetical protein
MPLFFGSQNGPDEISPFFQRPVAQHVSAVLYCNPTVPKFLWLAQGDMCGGRDNIRESERQCAITQQCASRLKFLADYVQMKELRALSKKAIGD